MNEDEKRQILFMIDELEYRIDSLAGDIKNLKDTSTSTNDGTSTVALDNLQSAITTNRGNIALLRQSVNTNTDNIAIIQTSISEINESLTLLETSVNSKQDALTAGDGIKIENNVISASGGKGLTNEQAEQLALAYNFYLSHQTETDPDYSGQTWTDYEQGTIFKVADSYAREVVSTTTSNLTFPTILFSAEAGCTGTINIIFDYKVLNIATNFVVQIKLNGTAIYQQAEVVETADTDYTFNHIFSADFNSTRDNQLEIILSLQGASSSSRTLRVDKLTVNISAPNVVISNNDCPFDVINIDGTYYIADCSDETTKVASISKDNIYNINSLAWNDTKISANAYKFVPQYTKYDNNYVVENVAYFYKDKEDNFWSCLDSASIKRQMPKYVCADYLLAKVETVNYLGARANENYLSRVIHNMTTNSMGYGSGKAGTGDSAKIVCSRLLEDYSYFSKTIPYPWIKIGLDGVAVLYGSYVGTFGTYSLGLAQDATLYLKNVASSSKFDVECYVKKFDKIVKYDLSYSSNTFTLNSQTLVGYYDKFFKMSDNDYFVVKNNILKYYKANQDE